MSELGSSGGDQPNDASGRHVGELDVTTAELLSQLDACGLYDVLKVVKFRLAELHSAGRLTMHDDDWNTEWHDPDGAVNTADTALEMAIAATKWMETRRR